MKIVVQIVKDARVIVNEKPFGQINYGLLLLVSFKHGDTQNDVLELVDKVIGMRIFPDCEGKTNLNITSVNGQIMSISQFTIYGEFKGRRPSFTNVMASSESQSLYDLFNKQLNSKIKTVTGVFGADMALSFTNVGPTTYIIESRNE